MKKIDGIYSAYMTGKEGQGFALFLFHNGHITGADPLGVTFDGTYKTSKKSKLYNISIKVTVPGGGTVIQGVTTSDGGISYDVNLELGSNFMDLEFLPLETPLGPVNIKLNKLRELG